MSLEPRFLTLRGAIGAVRLEMHDGREHVVVPVVALVEGVIHAVNAPSPELVRAAEFTDCADWEGMPVHAGHPMRDGVPISGRSAETLPLAMGLVRHPSVDGARLLMEAWLDPARCTQGAAQRVLERVRAVPPRPVEVSVGVFTNTEKTHGVWRDGKRYAAEWKGMKKDHLALLDDGKLGACSIEMGCGFPRVAEGPTMRVAEGGGLELEQPMSIKDRFAGFIRALMPRGWGDDEVKQELREALEQVEPSMRTGGGEIVRVKNDAVVYCLYSNYYDAAPAKLTYWQRGYAFDTATQKFTIDAERTQVEPTTHYEPYRAADGFVQEPQEPTPAAPCSCGNHAAAAAGEGTMDRKERIAALVANPHSAVKSLKMLEAATDDELKALEDGATTTLKAATDKADADKAKVAADKAEADRKAKEGEDLKAAQARADAAEAKLKVAEANQVTDEMKAIVEERKQALTAKKDGLVATLKAAQQTFTEEDLKAMSVEGLEKMATLVKVETPKVLDFSGRGFPRAASAGENYAPPDPYARDLAVK